MKSVDRRLKALETKLTPPGIAFDVIIRTLVRPGLEGPLSLGPHSASILSGRNAGLRLVRAEDETEAAFIERASEAGLQPRLIARVEIARDAE